MDLDTIQSAAGLSDPGTPGKIVSDAMKYLFGAAGIILILTIISAGYQMMTSRGDPKVMQTAQGKITNAVLGILILFVSFWLVATIMKFFGINIGLFVL